MYKRQGLLRPEAWLFAAIYWLYLWRGATPRERWALAALVALAPLLWALSDLLVTGNPLWSLTNTRHTASTLDRTTGLVKVPEYIPKRIGEVLGAPVLAAAVAGGIASLLWLRDRALMPALVGVCAVLVLSLIHI